MGHEGAVARTCRMKFLFAAGGTGGHVIPAIVVARELVGRHPDCDILFVGTAKGVENRLVPQAGFPLMLVDVKAWQGQALAARLSNLLGGPRAMWEGFDILKAFRPGPVQGVGGDGSGPTMLAPAVGGVPVAI